MQTSIKISRPKSFWHSFQHATVNQGSVLILFAGVVNTASVLAYETWANSHIGGDRIEISIGGGWSEVAMAVFAVMLYINTKIVSGREDALSLTPGRFEYWAEVSEVGINLRYRNYSAFFAWAGFSRARIDEKTLVLRFESGTIHVHRKNIGENDWAELISYVRAMRPMRADKKCEPNQAPGPTGSTSSRQASTAVTPGPAGKDTTMGSR
jgi:hypothetical protein